MRKIFLLLLLAVALMANPAIAARGIGSTNGVGASDRIVTGSNVTMPTTLSISAWMWTNGAGASNGGRFYDQNNTANALMYSNAGANLDFRVSFSSTNGDFFITPPSTGTWHHIAIVYNGASTSNVPVIYIDGSSVTVTTVIPPVGTYNVVNTQIVIGNRATADRNWNGKIAGFTIWNSLLTADEVTALYKGVSPLKIRRTAINLNLPLNGYQSGEADWSPNRSTTTVTGTAYQPNPGPTTPYPFTWTVGQ